MLFRSPIQHLQQCPDIQAVLDFTLAQSLSLSETELGNIQLMEWNSGYLEISSQCGFNEEFLTFFKHVTANDGSACGRALRKRESIVIADVMLDAEFTPCQHVAYRAGFRAVQSTPIVSTSGAMIGILSTHFPSPHRPSDAAMAALKHLTQSAADAIIFHRAAKNDINCIIDRSHKALEESHRLIERVNQALRRPVEGGKCAIQPTIPLT
jgi:GAF domain-containing protein